MSLGWKNFSFFQAEQPQADAQLPADVVATCSSAAHLFCGVGTGEVVALGRDLNLSERRGFQAHGRRLLKLAYAEVHGLLVTLGQDEVGLQLKVWSTQSWGRAAAAPALLRTLDAHGKQAGGQAQTQAQATQLAVYEGSWPQLTYAVGLSSGKVLLLVADTGKDRVARSELNAQPAGGEATPVTGLGFTVGERGPHLFVETSSQTLAFDIATGQKAVLDEMGGEAGCTTMDQEGQLVVARPEAVYLYTLDGRGPCFVFDGRKQQVGWVRHFLVAVTRGQTAAAATLQIFDLRNKLIACTLPLQQEPAQVACCWGAVLLLLPGGGLQCLRERPLAAKLELLFAKGLYLVALNLAHSEQAEPSAVAEIQRRFGDHLYAKHDHDAAMGQYLQTLGHLEPSFVIRRFLDAQRTHNLTAYLEALHAKGLASPDHTTLLLNCYTKLKAVEKLDEFLRASSATGDEPRLRFDVGTAIKVCRGAGYHEHALFVAHAAQQPEVYLDILVEDCGSWDEALAYLQALPRAQAAAALQRHGKALVTQRPEATTALLMQLCTPDAGGGGGGGGEAWLASVADFTRIFDERPQALALLCEFVLNSARSPPGEPLLFHTLLQLYLAPEGPPAAGGSGSGSAPGEPPTASPAARREQALELLRRGWPPGGEPRFSPDEALVLCRTAGFAPGLAFLYERLRLFREVLRVHLGGGDWAAAIEACVRHGDAARGGDAQLWGEALRALAAQEADVTPQIREVLEHVEAGGLLPPLLVLRTLAANPRLKLGLVKGYMARALQAESAAAEEDRRQIAQYEAETARMRAEVQELRTQARVFQNSRCAVSGAPLELPAVHFLCGHSCNARSLGENERECPLCAPQFRTILDIRRDLRAGAGEQDKFFAQLRSSADGFGVIADFFGRGLLNNVGPR